MAFGSPEAKDILLSHLLQDVVVGSEPEKFFLDDTLRRRADWRASIVFPEKAFSGPGTKARTEARFSFLPFREPALLNSEKGKTENIRVRTKRTTNGCLYFVALCNMTIFSSAIAGPSFSLYSVVEKWDEILKKWQESKSQYESVEESIVIVKNEIASIDGKYPFHPKAQTLRIGEFELEKAFNERVERQRKYDDEEMDSVLRKRRTEKNKLEEIQKMMEKESASWSTKMEQAAVEWLSFTNKVWETTLTLSASDLPYFNRESMSFMNISSPFITHEDEKRQIRFEVDKGYEKISLKFKRLSDAEAFKNGIVSGSINAMFVCRFSLGLPSDCTIREAWTEKKKVTGLKKVGMVAALLAVACVTPNDGYGPPSYGPNLGYDLIEHPAIFGRKYPVYIGERKLIIKGSGAKSLEIEISSSAEGWKLEVEK